MLVLSRKQAQVVCIGAAVQVHVLDIRGSSVRLGIDAPADTEIHRAEVHAEIVQERPINCCPTCGK